ncbi:MAG: SGNH/GDSL hydrolase family protein [Chloroflexi bacterium]|nr:SGNH/GDSL hydrolase family protein [Chloroflexota bacterium]
MSRLHCRHAINMLPLTALFTAVTLLLAGCQTLAAQPAADLPTLHPTAVLPTATLQPTTQPTAQPTTQPTIQPTTNPTSQPTTTPTRYHTYTSSPTPTPIPPGAQINGLPKTAFIVLPTAVQTNIRAIAAAGQTMDRRPQAFAKLGDSGAATADFLMRFDQRVFDLGDYAYLQPTLDYYKGSWVRFGAALHVGLHGTAVFRTELVTEPRCNPNEHMLACEFRLHNPSILLIALGTNDQSDQFDDRLEKIVTYAIDNGVIPVLITKADRYEGEDNRNNNDVRRIAAQFNVPLLDFDLLADTLPNRGLGSDNIHLTHYERYEYVSPEAFQRGYSVYNLAVIMMIDEIRAVLTQETAVPSFDISTLP